MTENRASPQVRGAVEFNEQIDGMLPLLFNQYDGDGEKVHGFLTSIGMLKGTAITALAVVHRFHSLMADPSVVSLVKLSHVTDMLYLCLCMYMRMYAAMLRARYWTCSTWTCHGQRGHAMFNVDMLRGAATRYAHVVVGCELACAHLRACPSVRLLACL